MLGFQVKQHEMVRIRKSRDVGVIRRKPGKPLAFRTSQGRQLVGLQIQLTDGGHRIFSYADWLVAKKQRIANPATSWAIRRARRWSLL